MGSETILKLPFIDFSSLDLESKNPKWAEVKSQVHRALEECGCFEALFDKVPLEIRKSLFVVLKELFDVPLQTKLRNVSEKPFHGYLGQYPQVPLYESIAIDDANVIEKVESLENTLWPEGYPSFSKTIQAFSEKLSELDQIVRKMVLESLGVEKYLDEHMNSTNYVLRVMKYSAPQTEDAKIGINSHTDKNIVTTLCQLNGISGLDVETKDGKWITYQPSSAHSFVVMIGNSFLAWSNGRLYSPFHRVMMTGNEARYSAGLFSIPKGGYVIKAPEELVDEEHPLLYKPFDHVEFLKYYYTEEGQRQKFALKAYCGV
ncbi:hypothetical protein K1719_021528 [Acacia pycnantha]|nr:hypothetical protein K1719_021528 [Acacia pycnantha]